jgi:hypothetical protein
LLPSHAVVPTPSRTRARARTLSPPFQLGGVFHCPDASRGVWTEIV